MRFTYLIFAALALVACGSDGGDIPYNGKGNGGEKPAAALAVIDGAVKENSLAVEARASTEYVDVRTNVVDWTATDDAEWLAVAVVRDPEVPATGVQVTQRLRITVAQNPGQEPRRASVTLRGGGLSAELEVVQAAAGAAIEFESPRNVGAAGGTIEVVVAANVEYAVVMPEGCDWVEDVTTEGTEDGVRNFRIAPNDGVEATSAEVVFEGGGVRKVLTINRQGGSAAVAVDGERERTVAWDATELRLTVTANTAYEVDIAESGRQWLWRAPGTRAVTERVEVFTLEPNDDPEPRETTIGLFVPDITPRVGVDIKVRQQGRPVEDVFELDGPTLHTLTWRGGKTTVRIRTARESSSIVAGGLPRWLSAVGEPRREGDVVIMEYEANENPGPGNRFLKLTFTSEGDAVTVEFVQGGNPSAPPDAGYSDTGTLGVLADYDLGTWVSGLAPIKWQFMMSDPGQSFNRLLYTPAAEGGRIGEYRVSVQDDATLTWYTVAQGTMPQSGETGFPTVTGARSVMLAILSAERADGVFAASEVHMVHDVGRIVSAAPVLSVEGMVTAKSDAGNIYLDVEANIPYDVEVVSAVESWLVRRPDLEGSDGRLAFALTANEGGERSVTLLIGGRGRGEGLERRATIVQRAAVARQSMSLLVPESGVAAVDAGGGGVDVRIDTELPLSEISYDALPEWIHFVQSGTRSASDAAVFDFDVEGNGGGERGHTIRFRGGETTLEVKIEQAAAAVGLPRIALVEPSAGMASFDHEGATTFDVVLSTNVAISDISVEGTRTWLTRRAESASGTGLTTYSFALAANDGDARETTLTFSAGGERASVEVWQDARPEEGGPSDGEPNGMKMPCGNAFYFDGWMVQHDASRVIDGRLDTYHTAQVESAYDYEFFFDRKTALTGIVYYPRQSAGEHGALSGIAIDVITAEGGMPIRNFAATIPASVFASEESRRKGWYIRLPSRVSNVTMVRITPGSSHQPNFSVAEMEFYD